MLEQLVCGCLKMPTRRGKSWSSWYAAVGKCQLTKGKSWNSWYETVRKYQLDEEKARIVGVRLLRYPNQTEKMLGKLAIIALFWTRDILNPTKQKNIKIK